MALLLLGRERSGPYKPHPKDGIAGAGIFPKAGVYSDVLEAIEP